MDILKLSIYEFLSNEGKALIPPIEKQNKYCEVCGIDNVPAQWENKKYYDTDTHLQEYNITYFLCAVHMGASITLDFEKRGIVYVVRS